MVDRRYTSTQINHCPHDLIYSCSKEYFKKDEDTSPTYFELPYPIHDALPYESDDIVVSVINEKEKYLEIKKNAKPHVQSTKEALTRCQSGSTSLPLAILNYYKTPDPDIYFNCDYNFYYTGGCIELVIFEGVKCCVRPNSENELWAFDFATGNNFNMHLKMGSPIMNLRVTYTNNSIFFTIREKNQISIVCNKNGQSPKFKLVWKKTSKVPFIDAKLSTDGNIIATVNADFICNVYNISQNRIIKTYPKELCCNDIDCFSQIEFYKESLIFANRNSIKLFDIHSDNVTELNLNLEACNTVCCFSVFEDSIYVATRHDLLNYDLTDLNQLCQYTSHFLSFPPCYMDITECDDDTFIILSAQKIDEKVIFGTKSLHRLPARLPSLMDTLHELKLRGDLLLKYNLEDHFNQSVTGIKLLQNGTRQFIISTNCTGQLFKQEISSEPFNELGPIDRLHDWLNKIPATCELIKPTAVVDMTTLFEKMTRKAPKLKTQKSRDHSNRDAFLQKFSADYRKENYCPLMSELMSVWEVDDVRVEAELSDNEQSEAKVATWIESQMFEYQSDDNN